jgi:hypothetical protein
MVLLLDLSAAHLLWTAAPSQPAVYQTFAAA